MSLFEVVKCYTKKKGNNVMFILYLFIELNTMNLEMNTIHEETLSDSDFTFFISEKNVTT